MTEPLLAFLKQHTSSPQEREQVMMIMETLTNPPPPVESTPSSVTDLLLPASAAQGELMTEEGTWEDTTEGTLACPCKGSCKNYPRHLLPAPNAASRSPSNGSGGGGATSPKIFSREVSSDASSSSASSLSQTSSSSTLLVPPAASGAAAGAVSSASASSLIKARTRTSSTTASGAEAEGLVMHGRISLPEFLALFPSCSPPLAELLPLLPLLTPRPYSVSCSPLVFPDSIHIVFTVTDTHLSFAGHTFARTGVATSYMERLCQSLATPGSAPPSLVFSVRHSSGFTLPDDLSQNILMIGAGTGIAPFRSFLQHLTYLRKQAAGDDLTTIPPKAFGCDECPQNLRSGRMRDIEDAPEGLRLFGQSWLFFGCRHPKVDCLFQEELETMQEVGALTKLELAFSRMLQEEEEAASELMVIEEEELVPERAITRHYHKYVQHILRARPRELYQMIASGRGTLFVCGSLDGMVRDTHQQLVALVREERRSSQQEAEDFLRTLEKEGRYVKEAWI